MKNYILIASGLTLAVIIVNFIYAFAMFPNTDTSAANDQFVNPDCSKFSCPLK